jgi:hypothetical protein
MCYENNLDYIREIPGEVNFDSDCYRVVEARMIREFKELYLREGTYDDKLLEQKVVYDANVLDSQSVSTGRKGTPLEFSYVVTLVWKYILTNQLVVYCTKGG